MVLVDLHEGLLLDPPMVAWAGHDGWRLVTPCNVEAADPRTERFDADRCPLLAEVATWEDREFQDFLGLFASITAKAKIARPWEQMMDRKQLHDVGELTLSNGAKTKLWQFEKKRTAIRLVWVYGGGKRVLLATHAFLKRQSKTPADERERAAGTARQFFGSVEQGTARLVYEQGGRLGFEVLYGK